MLQTSLNSGNYIKLNPIQFNKASKSSYGWSTPILWGWELRSYIKNWWFRLRYRHSNECPRTVEDLDTTFETCETLFYDSATVSDDKETEELETEPIKAAEATFALLADELEKKLKLLDDKNKELNEEVDRIHDKIREEDRVRKEFFDVMSDKIKEISTPKMLDMKKRIRVPNPETHIFKKVDLFEELKIGTDVDKLQNFKLLLEGDIRQWLDDITAPATWEGKFKKWFSTQDRLIRHLHQQWCSFSFDPSSEDIEMYIRDVKVTANQLGHGNDSKLKLIKTCMSTEIYGTLYSITDLADLIKMVKDIYAMTPDTSKTTAMTSTIPFIIMQ